MYSLLSSNQIKCVLGDQRNHSNNPPIIHGQCEATITILTQFYGEKGIRHSSRDPLCYIT